MKSILTFHLQSVVHRVMQTLLQSNFRHSLPSKEILNPLAVTEIDPKHLLIYFVSPICLSGQTNVIIQYVL